MIETTGEQIPMFSPDSWCGKTSSAHSAATEARTSAPCWKKLQGYRNQPFLYLNMSGGGGQRPELLSEPDGLWLGECMIPAGGASRSEEDVLLWSPTSMGYLRRKSCLSALLEEHPDPKYNLSPKACAGILRRAVRRGKIAKMPEILVKALEKQAGATLSEITLTEESSAKQASPSTLVGGGNRQPILFRRG